MQLKLFILPIVLVLFFFGCGLKDKSAGKAVAVYADYKISAEAGKENATCLVQFREGNKDGATLLLEPPAAVTFDGTALQADSANLSGAFYELQVPLATFAGPHNITFTGLDEKKYIEDFIFQPFAITSPEDSIIKRGDIVVQLGGLQPEGLLRVVLADTSFATPDINEVDTVKNGRLIITKQNLRNVASGPVVLYLFKEEERPLKNPPAGGGKLAITYSLHKELTLVD